jgi:hypothetical protein
VLAEQDAENGIAAQLVMADEVFTSMTSTPTLGRMAIRSGYRRRTTGS